MSSLLTAAVSARTRLSALALVLSRSMPAGVVYLCVAVVGVGYAGAQMFPMAMLPDVASRTGDIKPYVTPAPPMALAAIGGEPGVLAKIGTATIRASAHTGHIRTN